MSIHTTQPNQALQRPAHKPGPSRSGLWISVFFIMVAFVGCKSVSPEEQQEIEKRNAERAKENMELEKEHRNWWYMHWTK